MKFGKYLQRFTFVLMLSLVLALPMSVWGQQKKASVTYMTLPFGTVPYSQAIAFEQVYKKADTWVEWKAQETPGAMYIVRYYFENMGKLASGEVPQVVAPSSTSVLTYLVEGRKPFDKFRLPTNKALMSNPSFIQLFVTFDSSIKDLTDLEGKKVGIDEKSRPFSSTLALLPYFKKGLNSWDKIGWQYLGANNSKDALLNNKVDAHSATFMGSVDVAADGSFYSTAMAPGSADLELMNAGRKLHFLSYDPEIFKKAHDFSTDLPAYPILVKKGSVPGLDRDIYGRLTVGIICVDESMSDDVVQEILRVRWEHWKEFGKYHASLKLLPKNPYPIGTPEEWVHPGVKKAMRNLGIPIPGE